MSISQATRNTLATMDLVNKLQARIGEGNAKRGFHEQTVRVVDHFVRTQHRAQVAPRDAEGRIPEKIREEFKEAQHALRVEVITKLALISTEVSEAIEEVRNGEELRENYYTIDGQRVTWSDNKWWNNDRTRSWHGDVPAKPEGLPSEIADIVVRCLDLAYILKLSTIDLILEKLAYNDTRDLLHGKQL